MTFPKYYIASRSTPQKGLLSLVCYDRMMFTDKEFDCSGFLSESGKKEDEVYPLISSVVSALISQCGFTGGGSVNVYGATVIPPDEIRGASCRKILETLSAGACGIWYCSKDNALTFLPLAGSDTTIFPKVYAAVKGGLTKGPISRVIAENSETGETFDTLGGNSVSETVRTESIFASAENINGILTACRGYEMRNFSCDKLLLEDDIEIGGIFYAGETEYKILAYSLSFSPGGVFAAISAPALNESEFGYFTLAERAAMDALQAGRKHKNVMISKYEGFNFVGRDS